MTFVPSEEVYQISGSRYAAVIIASKEARRINALPTGFRSDIDKKITTLALERLEKGLIKFEHPKKRKLED